MSPFNMKYYSVASTVKLDHFERHVHLNFNVLYPSDGLHKLFNGSSNRSLDRAFLFVAAFTDRPNGMEESSL